MKKFIAFMAILALLVSCGKSGQRWIGELKEVNGILRTIWYDFSTGGAYIMGKSDDDVASQDAPKQ
jgi:hypothetical protein